MPNASNISEYFAQCEFCGDITDHWYHARQVYIRQTGPHMELVAREWRYMCDDCFMSHGFDRDGVRIEYWGKWATQHVA